MSRSKQRTLVSRSCGKDFSHKIQEATVNDSLILWLSTLVGSILVDPNRYSRLQSRLFLHKRVGGFFVSVNIGGLYSTFFVNEELPRVMSTKFP